MKFNSQSNYKGTSDEELVRLILTPPRNEEAAVFLLYDRYAPLLRSIYKGLTTDLSWYDDCVHELFIHLKGKEQAWLPLTTFANRSSFGTWLKRVARNKFLELLPKLIDNPEITISVDGDDADKAPVQLPDEGVEDYERRQLKVLLLEAVGQLDDPDQKFVILKRLQGYDSREIALLLQKRWQKHGIRKFNNRHEEVVPDAAYVDVRTQRAKENLRKIIAGIK
jgi:RNA polymerase sigma factor (sigma-70 family)